MTTYHIARTAHYAVINGALRKSGISNRILAVIDHGPCRTPIRLLAHGKAQVLPCRRRLASWEQCESCRIEIEIIEHHQVIDTDPTDPAPVDTAPADTTAADAALAVTG